MPEIETWEAHPRRENSLGKFGLVLQLPQPVSVRCCRCQVWWYCLCVSPPPSGLKIPSIPQTKFCWIFISPWLDAAAFLLAFVPTWEGAMLWLGLWECQLTASMLLASQFLLDALNSLFDAIQSFTYYFYSSVTCYFSFILGCYLFNKSTHSRLKGWLS